MTRLWTVGHSTRTEQAFLDDVAAFGIRRLVDIRRFPTSKRHPQFRVDPLRRSLHGAGIRYEYLGDQLGGMRDLKGKSRHVGLHDSGFQPYADWMETPAFRQGMDRLLAWAQESATAVMCAERNPKSCHRKLLSDHALMVRGADVTHILEAADAHPHEPTPGARVVDGNILYLSADAAADIQSYGDAPE